MDIAIQYPAEVETEADGQTTVQTVQVQVLLASDANNRTVGEWGGPKVDSSEVEFEVQTTKPIGAAHAVHYPRGNAEGVLRFSATMVCATGEAAASLMVSWPRQVPPSGTLLVDGAEAGACALKSVRMKCRGREVTADYHILC